MIREEVEGSLCINYTVKISTPPLAIETDRLFKKIPSLECLLMLDNLKASA